METFDRIMISLLFLITFFAISMVILEQNQKQIQEIAKIICENNQPQTISKVARSVMQKRSGK